MLDTPVVFIIFRRPEPTQRVFDRIAKAQPKQLFVIADGPRNDEDVAACQATRAIIQQVDWPCEVRTNFAEHNLGLRKRISSGLDWVFEQTETAIILEDDCLPHPTFFRFCEELLDYYRTDDRVMHISGDNFGYKRTRGVKDSYYFSRYAHVWGWATWRRAWAKYDVDMSDWPTNQEKVLATFDYIDERRYWQKQWDDTYHNERATWDYQWLYTCLLHEGLCAMPYENQISNIGMGSEGTNTNDSASPVANLPTQAMAFPLHHPQRVYHNIEAERHAANLFWRKQFSLARRIYTKLQRLSKRYGKK